MSYKVFVNGFPLNASELNQFLMRQSIAVFIDATARNASIETPVEGQFAYLTGSDNLVKYNGSAWVDAISIPDTSTSVTAPVTNSGTSTSPVIGLGVIGTANLPTGPADGTLATAATGFGYTGIPQNATTTGAYTLVAADAGKHIYASATRTTTIPANSAVALPIGTTVVFVAGTGATMTISITTDTLLLAGPGTTGSRTLAPFGIATAVKITATSWLISGNGLT